jgi:ABC-2 type transport system permease protein
MMPTWLKVISHVNPLTYEVSALRGLLIGTPTNYWVDVGVLLGSAVVGIAAAAALIGRLAR